MRQAAGQCTREGLGAFIRGYTTMGDVSLLQCSKRHRRLCIEGHAFTAPNIPADASHRQVLALPGLPGESVNEIVSGSIRNLAETGLQRGKRGEQDHEVES